MKIKRFFVLFAVSLLYTLPVYDKFWAPYDEGIIMVAAQRLLRGEVPYRDFFIIMYPPGQIYVLGFLLKAFSSPIIAGRLYTVFISVGMSIVVFYMTHLLTGRVWISIFSWFIALTSFAPRLGAIPTPIWPGVFLALCALYIYMGYLENSKGIVFAGIIGGLCVIFRHDMGIFVIISIAGTLFIKLLYDRKAFKEMTVFLLSPLVVILPSLAYFIKKSAMHDLIKSLFLFPFIHEKTAKFAFPEPCFDLNMIFHKSLYFINANQYYIPLLIYISTIIYIANEFFRHRLCDKKNLMLAAILIFGILSFNQVRIRPDPAHLLTVIAPTLVLFGFITEKTITRKLSFKVNVLFAYFFSLFMLFLFILLSIKNIDKYAKNTFRKVYKKDIIKTSFAKDAIYIPKEERDDVVNTVNFIKENTEPFENIYVGNITHGKDDFGGSTIIYFLADRIPSTKYYELAPGLVTDPDVQEEIKNSLSEKCVNLIVLQDIDTSTGTACFDTSGDVLRGLRYSTMSPQGVPVEGGRPSPSSLLDDYISANFKPVQKFGKYNIYKRSINVKNYIYRQGRRYK